MENAVSLHGCVLKHKAVGDYDWLVTLLTAERGKLNAFARLARKPGTRFCGNTEPLSFGTFELFPGKSAYALQSVKIDRFFESFRQDLEKAAYGSLFLEIADYYNRENMEASRFLNLLYLSLRALEEENARHSGRIVRCVYELRAMVKEGVFPGTDNLTTYSPALKKTLQHIETAPLKSLYSFSLRDDVQRELAEVTVRYRNTVMDRKLKSLDMLELYEGE